MDLPSKDMLSCYEQLRKAINLFKGPEAFVLAVIDGIVRAETSSPVVHMSKPKDVRALLQALRLNAIF